MSEQKSFHETYDGEHDYFFLPARPMRPFYRRIGLLFMLFVFLTGCGVRDWSYNPVHFQPTGILVPPEVVLSKRSVAGRLSADGLYPENAGSNAPGLCCWIASFARLRIKKSAPARSLILTGYVPDLPLYRKHSQHLIVTFPDLGGVRDISKLKPGFNVVSVAVPRLLQRRTGAVLVQLECTVPLLVSGQRYGVVLTSAYFE